MHDSCSNTAGKGGDASFSRTVMIKASKIKTSRTIAVVVLMLALGACERGPTCPGGTKKMGAGPPNGQEVWCVKANPATGDPVLDAKTGKPIKEGPFVLYSSEGQKILEGTYSNGRQVGRWVSYYDNGQPQTLDEYQDGVQQGRHLSWYANGQKATEGEYVAGKREGQWHHWDVTGLKNWDEQFKNDQKVSG
jgi:hypothetical protein